MRIISIIVPVYNEEKNIPLLYDKLTIIGEEIREKYDLEIIFVNDGSTDTSQQVISDLSNSDDRVKYVELSRNFGKEVALTAGINNCRGVACIMLDADLQHPVELIPEFIRKWKEGAETVIGIREENKNGGLIKNAGSSLFYRIINRIASVNIIPGATDFRLLDRIVIDEFNKFTERNRISRGLMDWLGFKRSYIWFKVGERVRGRPGYSFFKLLRLAMNSFVSLSLFPLKIAGYLGLLITTISGIMGLFIFIENFILKDPMELKFSGPAMLAVFIMFLVGVVLSCLGLMALYIAAIHGEVVNRPLYVVRKKNI
ncbi:MAG: glycosyltransferase family 2 protein [Candidatus Euphemobacter frigidus]|nr:glycosyltransferase family 2 protein [Candidatus Euphemobacter frigidus]MDP8275307.1 glycosyltransferase family 2 protein [Candidatus Euphemobacter frigidus]